MSRESNDNSAALSKVAVFNGVGEPIEIREQRVPKLSDGEALVRITYCTICGSDLHTFTGNRPGPTPMVLGHEILGVIDQMAGEIHDVAGQPLSVGDRVTWSVAASCHKCYRCQNEMPQKCDSLFKYGHELMDDSGPSGGLGEHCLLRRGTAIVAAPSGVADKVLCPANCATATVAAAVRTAGLLEGRRVMVVGAGMLGLTTAAMAATFGAVDVCVCDVDAERLGRATDFGATAVCGEVPSGDFDVVFEMSGNSQAVERAINSATVGGKVVLVGSVSPSPAVSLDPERVVRRLLSIHGVHNYRPEDLETAVEFLRENHQRFPFADLVDSEYPLSDAGEALEYAVGKRPIRVAVVP